MGRMTMDAIVVRIAMDDTAPGADPRDDARHSRARPVCRTRYPAPHRCAHRRPTP
ncbi:hypothetical protein BN159_p26 (plasmid) [Streptomyces davaonensis JCM 4913]|uniref:Uncharacterized protein n=1 Tax=Streptomyces davaonensis (strain DSM 101723 / JCM 4913 / KCC S-0913 / 768) TaxID=1214101 RepID=K4R9G1_STRDJ|nr:hypothetical protein BN159_p26 [Streptomyces davaonensis JCM 4913]